MGRTLYDIAQILESTDGADERVRHVLERLGRVCPYQQCGLLEARLGGDPRVVVVPEPSPEEQTLLTGTLVDLFDQLALAGVGPRAPATRPRGSHLAVPLIGLDEVIGVLFVRAADAEYTVEHLRSLSVVAAALAAYLTSLRARSELAELARERDEARRAAEAANRTKDEFLALVSHELKTPLSSLLAWAHTLRSATDAALRARAIDEVERSVQAQSRMIDDILDLSCIASAQLRLNVRTVEPAVLIRSIIDGFRLQAERKSVRLESSLDAAAMPLAVDPDRFRQVVSILIRNAIAFTPAGGHVEVHLDRSPGHARIRVSDGGSGISSEALPRIFDRSGPAAGAGGRAEGPLGGGLATVKDLVELHGGRVGATSEGAERGATFTIDLPRLPAVRAVPDPLPGVDGSGGRALAGVRVLVVDHDPALRESFQAVLETWGAAVTAVASAPEALAALERSELDAILFGDLAIRGESIYDLMREVTARASTLPIASISAWRDEERERELGAGFRLHLTKPVEISALVAAVADLAGRGSGRRLPGLGAGGAPDGG